MKKTIFVFLFISLCFAKEVLLDKFEIKNYRLEIRHLDRVKKKDIYLYFFKKNKDKYSFYRCYDLKIKKNGYFYGSYDENKV